MILDIDIGNSRLKWLLRGGREGPSMRGAFPHDPWPEQPFPGVASARRVRISSVMGARNPSLVALCRERWGVEPEFARVESGVAGLQCGYDDPARLGVDRWLAVLACWQTIARQALVVDAGSALTMDILTAEGHLGGYIVPGLQMMQQALGVATWGVRAERELAAVDEPGRETSAAVINGCLSALAGAVEHAAARAGLRRVVLTGGDGEAVAGFLDDSLDIVLVPDLVLDGLAIALP